MHHNLKRAHILHRWQKQADFQTAWIRMWRMVNIKWKTVLLAIVCAMDLCLLAGLIGAARRYGAVHVWAQKRFIALTFDDGPDDVYTAKLLDGLKERGIHATFFLMGQKIKGNEALVERMHEEGHLIGNHSYSHIPLTKAGTEAVCLAVEQTSDMIEEITGARPQYIRPPYGDWNDELECRMDMTTVLWSVDSLDWKLLSKNAVVKRVLKEAEDGDIILMHDIFPSSVSAALEIVDALTREGYTFVTINELLID